MNSDVKANQSAYLSANNDLVRAVQTKNKDAVNAAYEARKEAMAKLKEAIAVSKRK